MNWWLFFLVALVPLLVGAIYYHPKVAGNLWMRASGVDEEKLKRGNMLVIFGMCYLFSLLLSVILSSIVVHQSAIGSLLMTEPGWGEAGSAVADAVAQFDAETNILSRHRSFGHGFFHGILTSLVLVGPVLAINALFERRRWNYVLIHVGYWSLTLGLMGGILAQFLDLGW